MYLQADPTSPTPEPPTTRRSRFRVALAVLCSALIAPLSAVAQEESPTDAPPPVDARTASDIVDEYMERLGLKRLQAEELGSRLGSAAGADRLAIAERLAKLYVQLLSEATEQAERRTWEDRSRDLLRQVPEADSFELRLGLVKTLHLQATETVERQRLRLVTPEEAAEAERVLRSIEPQLTDIAQKVNRRVENLEALEERGDTSEKLSDELADGRRLRSQAFYYLGWTQYYLALVTGADEPAAESLKSFGWLLNSRGGRVPAVDRIPKGMFKYEHVARAAAGCALSTGLRGNPVSALAWLDAIEETEDLAPAVQANLLTWRISVLAHAKRWADLERLVRLVRKSDQTGGGANVAPLPLVSARLLAVSALEADHSLAGDVLQKLAAIAMGDLVAGGEISHVLDLVQRFGSVPLGETGFISNYVRGIQQYEKARAAHKAAAGPPSAEGPNPAEAPTADPDAVAAYRLAGSLLKIAVEEPDADGFRIERTKASQLWAFTLYYTGELAGAAERFVATADMAATPAQAEEAHWLAVLSLDQAVEKGNASLAKRRDEAAALFLQTHPNSEHAPKLLLRRAMGGALDPQESVRILMGVDADSPMYATARQHAARLLYQQYRAASGADRDFAAMKFVALAEEVLNIDRRIALNPDDPGAPDAAARVVARVRQILDALLSGASIDASRAEAALNILTTVANDHKIDTSAFAGELTFRRVQIAIAKADFETAASLIEELQAEGGQFAVAADRLMYRRAIERYERKQDGPAAARELIRYGRRLIDRHVVEPNAMKDNVVLSLHQVVAAAATELWRAERDSVVRDLAVTLDTRMLAAQPRNQAALRRLAENADAAGDAKTALDCWRTLMAGLTSASDEWFEARYQSLRLLAATEPARAKQVLLQHLVLYPDYGPEPWGPQIKKLEQELANVPAPAGDAK